ncbi:hypothetical protein DFA_07842 [Cavenderia fasciculata]|uniref:Uncharacterized protein n=1 Tax=Cavenderia fasciculata TaxID=261658 RepID=F4Q3P6_CACFS|nr:uncharacterized protein DFA_07842 [Cavenderia fasciculata]EGG16862.1 hypothetical protein DFA_07842 [Cavenderia fasciculata]|eukprot:XP_004355336.1 hypothetical protein DFA_07842 [Cavenderia fasciculata]
MGRSPPEDQPLLGGSKDPYSFMYPGSGSISTLTFSEGGPINSDDHHHQHNGEEVLIGTKDENYDLSGSPAPQIKKIDGTSEHKIGQLLATAICGNDITSSIFYTSSLCTAAAGKYAPVSLLIVYGEVGSALPLNGGAYNVLLNTTSKQIASLAAALTMISYVATGVVSAYTAMQYLNGLAPSVPLHISTIALLGGFALLNLVGIGESAIVAFVIFVFHMITLGILVFGGFIALFAKGDYTVLKNNWHDITPPDVANSTFCQASNFQWISHDPAYNIYFGFGAAMLGVTGFETSSNFIEQQSPGVFPKTLRNMWAIVTLFNPLIGFLNLCFLHVCEIAGNSSGVLAEVAGRSLGYWFRLWVGIDACLVLSGSVITAYVGIIGLVRRMALDRCLPQFLIIENPWRKTNHFIIIFFFLVCTSLFIMAGFKTTVLAGVYTIAFLGVMSLFAVGNMLLKYKRSSLKREIKSPWMGVIFALCFVLAALAANIINDTSIVYYFAIYFIVTALIIALMFIRARVLKMILYFSRLILKPFTKSRDRFSTFIGESIKDINSQSIIFFASKDDPAYLTKAILYIRDNEQTNWVRIIHCYDSEAPPEGFAENISFLDRCFPKIRIDLITILADFSPSTVEKVSNMLNIPKNFMFIACPRDHLPHGIGELGGVRIISF